MAIEQTEIFNGTNPSRRVVDTTEWTHVTTTKLPRSAILLDVKDDITIKFYKNKIAVSLHVLTIVGYQVLLKYVQLYLL